MTSIPRELRPPSMQAHERSLRQKSCGGLDDEDELDWATSLFEPSTIAGDATSRSRAQTAEASARSHRRPPDMFGLRQPSQESAESVLSRRLAEAQRPFSFEVSAERRGLAARLKELQVASPLKTDETTRPQRRAAFIRASVSRIREHRGRESPEISDPGSEPRRAGSPSSPTTEVKIADPSSLARPSSVLLASDIPANTVTLQAPESYTSIASDGLRTVLSWKFPLPGQPRNCAVAMCVLEASHPDFLELVFLRVLSHSQPSRVLFEMRLSVDEAHETANLIKYLPQAVDEGSSNIQAILHNMFYEYDTDRSGSLSYDELAVMLSRLGLGIGPEDLNKLIAEADLDDDGRVDYLEFVSIAASNKASLSRD